MEEQAHIDGETVILPDDELCYRAVAARDARFDGRFFTCVRSTGIYCRPVCPAPTPGRKQCVFVPSAAAAEAAGFRSCLRCRPEAAPGAPAWTGTQATVTRALRLIEAGALDREDVESARVRSAGLDVEHGQSVLEGVKRVERIEVALAGDGESLRCTEHTGGGRGPQS